MTAAPEPAAADRLLDETVRRAVKNEFDSVLPHLVAALKRDRAFDALDDRLRRAERRLESRQERPLVLALAGLLHRLRHLDFAPEVKASLDDELVKILEDAGFQEIGAVREPFDPTRHDPIEGRTEQGRGVVVRVLAHGLVSYGDVLLRAKVAVAPATNPADPADDKEL
jgi:GrpE